MSEQKKFYGRCSFGVVKVGETPVVAGNIDGRITAKGVQVGEFNGKKYAKFSLSVQNQSKNLVYWGGLLGANEEDFFIKVADNGSEYASVTIYVAERDVAYAEKNLKAGDIVDVTGFLRFSNKDGKRFVNLNAHSGGIKKTIKPDTNSGESSTPKEAPSTTSEEAKYTPESPDIEEDDLPF